MNKTNFITLKKLAAPLSFLLTLILTVSANCLPVSAAEMITLPVTLKYGQSEARTMLNMINEFRTGGNAWYWDPTDTEKISVTVPALEYDYGLEQIAMQRAAEVAVSFDHERPNGTMCFTVVVDGNYSTSGENLAAGNAYSVTTAAGAFEVLQETNEPYWGQGHRRNMLEPYFGYVGIGHVVADGVHYWVQEFGYWPSGISSTAANDGYSTVNVDIDSSIISDINVSTSGDLRLKLGDTLGTPTATVRITTPNTFPFPVAVTMNPDWTVSGNAVSISGGSLTANNVGSSTLTATLYGKTVSLTAEVECATHSWSNWKTQRAATCTDYGTEERSCTVCGTGDSRTVNPTGHNMGSYKTVREPTEQSEGLEERSCSACGYTEQRSIAKLPPTTTTTAATKATTTSGKTAETQNTTVTTTRPQEAVTTPNEVDSDVTPIEEETASTTTTADVGVTEEATAEEETDKTTAEEAAAAEETTTAPEVSATEGADNSAADNSEEEDDDSADDGTVSNAGLYIVFAVIGVLIAGGGAVLAVIFIKRK